MRRGVPIRAALAAALLGLLWLAAAPAPAGAGAVLDRIVERKIIRMGVRTDAPPFSYIKDGRPQGFTADLCGLMAGAILVTSELPELTATIKTVGTVERFEKLKSGEIDVLCGATTATLTRRETMSFTIPTFSTGVSALVSADADPGLTALDDKARIAAEELDAAFADKRIGFRAGTTTESWLATGPLREAGASRTGFDDHAEGLAAVAEGNIDIYFADRAILEGLLNGAPDRHRFLLSRRTFTSEPYALAIPRGDEDLRLVMDRALSHLYRSGAIFKIYERYFGPPRREAEFFYAAVTLPE